MIKICHVCGYSERADLQQCPDCGAMLAEVGKEIYTCSDCAYFIGFNCTRYPTQKQITGPPQCSAFQLSAKNSGFVKDETMSLKDIDDLNNLDEHPNDSTFIKNVPQDHLLYYTEAAKETKAMLNPKVATKNGVPYTKYPIIALFLIAGPSKEEYFEAVRKQIRENLPSTQFKNSLLDINYAKMEKDIIKKQGINPSDPYCATKHVSESATDHGGISDEDDDWGDSDYWEEEYKYEQGFYQNTTNEDSKIWLKAAHNIGITIDLREDATNHKGEPIPDYLAIYIPDEDERARAKELSDAFSKVQEKYELTKPANPSTYNFAAPLPIDLEELHERLKGPVKVPIISMDATPTTKTTAQLEIVFRNPLSEIDKKFVQLLIFKVHKETKEENLEVAKFGKSLKEGLENPDEVLAEISNAAEDMPDLFTATQEEIASALKTKVVKLDNQKEKAYSLPEDMKASIQNMFTGKEIEKAQEALGEMLAKYKPNTPAAKSKMLLKILNKMELGKKQKIDEKILEQSKNLDDDLFVPEQDEPIPTLPSSGQSISSKELEQLKKDFFGAMKVPKEFMGINKSDLEQFESLVTVSHPDAAYYAKAADALKVTLLVTQAKTPFGKAGGLYDISIYKGELHLAAKLLEAVTTLKNQEVMDAALNKATSPMYMGVDWAKGHGPKKKKCKKLKPGQRKVRFKKNGKDEES